LRLLCEDIDPAELLLSSAITEIEQIEREEQQQSRLRRVGDKEQEEYNKLTSNSTILTLFKDDQANAAKDGREEASDGGGSSGWCSKGTDRGGGQARGSR
jgi:hypothetical protein